MNIQYAGVCTCNDGVRRLIWISSYSNSDGSMTSKDFKSEYEAFEWLYSQWKDGEMYK